MLLLAAGELATEYIATTGDSSFTVCDRRGDREQAAEQIGAERSRLLKEHTRAYEYSTAPLFIYTLLYACLSCIASARRAARTRLQVGVRARARHPAATGHQLGATAQQLQQARTGSARHIPLSCWLEKLTERVLIAQYS